MSRRTIGNVVASALAIGAGFAAIWASEIIKRPSATIDWVVLVLTGITSGTLVFFIAWGHFQSDPIPPQDDGAKPH